jgi:2'-hydroxyisoflavone reductase
MKLLVLGGTVFLGRGVVEAALARGHEVTMFNRGNSNPDLFPEVEKLRGNRDGELDALEGRTWDVVVDPSGYVPRLVRASAELLADAVEHYTFISTISVYAEGQDAIDENSAVQTLEDETVEQVTGETYGGLKVLCERAAEKAMPGRILQVRAGLIVGPHDPTDRFTYWPLRVARGDEVLAPGKPEQRTQFIDVRDLAAWIVHMAEARKVGVYNATGVPMPMQAVLDTCKTVSGSDTQFTWVSEKFLLGNEVAPFTEMPLWLPEANSNIMATSIQRATADGLTFRPLTDTVRDTLAWNRAGLSSEWRAGMTGEREQELLVEWKTRE